MKRKYEAPTVEVVEIETLGPLASSTTSTTISVHEDEEWDPEEAW